MDLRFDLAPIDGLAARERQAMYALMHACYEGLDPDRFAADLARKDLVILVRAAAGEIRGFSTVAWNPGGLGDAGYDVVFSGDTIMAPGHWGSQALSQGFRTVLGGCKGIGGGRPLYWFLISKGHRTYLYMPYYFRRYYPAATAARGADLSGVADACARALFPGAWDEDAGVVRFAQAHDHLKPAFAEVAPGKRENPHVRFFLERNPGYRRGDELACVARVEAGNLLRPDPACFGAAETDPPAVLRDLGARRARRAA